MVKAAGTTSRSRLVKKVQTVERVRTVTIMIGLNSDGTSSAVMAVMDPTTKKYHFVRLADRMWWGEKPAAVEEALTEAAHQMVLDPECVHLLR